jgi:hypothetical protein
MPLGVHAGTGPARCLRLPRPHPEVPSGLRSPQPAADDLVSQQLFNSYPVAVRARLGSLTRAYQVLRGSELIALGIRNCNESRKLVATASAPRKSPTERPRSAAQPSDQGSILDGLVQGVMAALRHPVSRRPRSRHRRFSSRGRNPRRQKLSKALIPYPATAG